MRLARGMHHKKGKWMQTSTLTSWPVGPLTEHDQAVALPLPLGRPLRNVARQGPQLFAPKGEDPPSVGN